MGFIDILILAVIITFALVGYSNGLLRGLTSLVSPVLGIWLALRHCDALAALIEPIVKNPTTASIIGFLSILFVVWLALHLVHKFLLRLVDWERCLELDHFLGGMLGLAKGVALLWLLLALGLTAFPRSVDYIEDSQASVRLLAIGERLGGDRITSGEELSSVEDSYNGMEGALAAMHQIGYRQVCSDSIAGAGLPVHSN